MIVVQFHSGWVHHVKVKVVVIVPHQGNAHISRTGACLAQRVFEKVLIGECDNAGCVGGLTSPHGDRGWWLV